MPQKEFSDKFVLICEEAEICKRLSSNDVKVRRKGVSALKHLLRTIDSRKVVDSTDFSRLWNGIFHFVWMSDKLLTQEEDVESISRLIHVLKKHEMLFVRGFFESLTSQWNRISQYRTDKFLMMVRRFLRQILFLLKNAAWNSQKIELFAQELYSAIQILPLGLVLHLNDIYIEEIAKVSEGNISTEALILLLKGYVDCIVTMKPSMNVVNHINSNIFSGLTRQLKLHIKQKAVLAAERNDEVVSSSDEIVDELSEERVFDPRPGNVDVFLPFIEFDETKMVEFLQNYECRPALSVKVKNILSQIINMFKSITKLRESIYDPKKISNESYNNTNKRKKRRNHFGALIKKSCKRLEMLEAESDNFAAEERMIKKLEKMDDLIQIPVGKKLVTVEKNSLVSSKNQKKLKSKASRVARQTWTVTDSAAECELVASSSKRADPWKVSESKIESENSSIYADDSQNIVLEMLDSTIENSSRSSPSPSKQSPSETSSSLTVSQSVNEETLSDSKLSSPKSSAQEVASKSRTKRLILTSDCPAWISIPKAELTSWIPKGAQEQAGANLVDADDGAGGDDDVDYDISGLFASPPQQQPRRRRSVRPPVLEVKRSARLANKAAAAKLCEDKKVVFTHNNSFQEVREYYSTLRSSPKNPYDSSKAPLKSILKPFAVPGPINPFYFPNGQPKLLNLRKQRLQRFF